MLKNLFHRMPLQNGQRRSFDNGKFRPTAWQLEKTQYAPKQETLPVPAYLPCAVGKNFGSSSFALTLSLSLYFACSGSGIIGPGLTSIMNGNGGMIGQNGAMDAAFSNLRSLSEDRELNGMGMSQGMDMMDLSPTTLTTNSQLSFNSTYRDTQNNGEKRHKQIHTCGRSLGHGRASRSSCYIAYGASYTVVAELANHVVRVP